MPQVYRVVHLSQSQSQRLYQLSFLLRPPLTLPPSPFRSFSPAFSSLFSSLPVISFSGFRTFEFVLSLSHFHSTRNLHLTFCLLNTADREQSRLSGTLIPYHFIPPKIPVKRRNRGALRGPAATLPATVLYPCYFGPSAEKGVALLLSGFPANTLPPTSSSSQSLVPLLLSLASLSSLLTTPVCQSLSSHVSHPAPHTVARFGNRILPRRPPSILFLPRGLPATIPTSLPTQSPPSPSSPEILQTPISRKRVSLYLNTDHKSATLLPQSPSPSSSPDPIVPFAPEYRLASPLLPQILDLRDWRLFPAIKPEPTVASVCFAN